MVKYEVKFKCPPCNYTDTDWRGVSADTYVQALSLTLKCPISEEHEMIVVKVREVIRE